MPTAFLNISVARWRGGGAYAGLAMSARLADGTADSISQWSGRIMGRAAHNVSRVGTEGKYMYPIAHDSGLHTFARRSAKRQGRRSASPPEQRYPAS